MSVERVVPDQVVTDADRREAEAASEQAKSGAANLWEGLARLVACNGWFALGYRSFRTWAHEELGTTLGQADLQLRKTRVLMALAEETGLPVAQLEERVPIRKVNRKPKPPVLTAMKAASAKLAAVPILSNPDEINAAHALRDHLNRLLEA